MKWASSNLISRWIMYMSTKSHAHTRCGTFNKTSISTSGYAEIHRQSPFFDNKNSIWKVLGLKIQKVETCSNASSTCRNYPALVKLSGPPCLKTPIPPSNPRIKKIHKKIWIQNKIIQILDVWWFNIPASVELRGPPSLKTPIPHSNPQILNTHKQILINNKIRLF
jgi:hypothetical protein